MKISLAGTALASLAAMGAPSAALAQATADPLAVSQAVPAPNIDSLEAAPAGSPPTGAMAATGQTPSAPLAVQVRPDGLTVTSGPVPDTAANRAKYGGPMSNAGKKTSPTGN